MSITTLTHALSRRSFAIAVAALTGSVVIAGCSSPSEADLTGGNTSQGDGAGAANVGARTPQQIQDSGSIIIGTFADKAPFGSLVSNDQYEGYDIEYGNRIGQDLGVDVQWVSVDAASRVEFLKSGKVDVILANFTITPERAEQVDFANPYMKVSFGAVSPQSAPVTDESQLADKKILIVRGTTQDAWISKHHPDWDVTKYEQYSDVTNALADGRGDVWITDNTEALAYSAKNDEFVTGIASFGEESTIAAAVQKGNDELRNWLNDDLTKLGEQQFFHEAYQKTLEPAYGDVVNPDDIVVEGGVVTK